MNSKPTTDSDSTTPRVENGTFIVLFVMTLIAGKQRACPVCSLAHSRDGIMLLYETKGGKYWSCSHQEDCGFCFPDVISGDDGGVAELARLRVDFLQTQAAAV